MGAKTLAKRLVFSLLANPWTLRRKLERAQRERCVTILNLHKIGKPDGSYYPPLDASLFHSLLEFLVRHFAVVTFARLSEPAAKPKLILSFDDGYKDFIEVGVPQLERHGLSANQNIVPECAESLLPPLNVLVQDFIGQAPAELVQRLDIPQFGPVHKTAVSANTLSAFLKNRPQREQRAIADQLVPQLFDWDGFSPTAMMSSDEIRQVSKIHEIGAHSFSHSSMEYETDEFLREDLDRCASYFQQELRRPMNIYAFPNGSCRPGQVRIVQEAGVEHVLLVGEDYSGGDRVHKRFTFYADGEQEARFRAVGGMRAAFR